MTNKETIKEQLLNRSYILENLSIGARQTGSSKQIVRKASGLPGIEEYLIVKGKLNGESYTVTVTHELLGLNTISVLEAWETALKNLHREIQIQPINQIINQIAEGVGMEDVYDEVPTVTSMYVMGVSDGVRGAGAIADLDAIREFAKRAKTEKIYLLPSSIHEVLLVPDPNGIFSLDELTNMVRSVNAQTVIPEEQLADRAYELHF